MSLIISTGSNLGDRESYLAHARDELSKSLSLIFKSKIYQSSAVDYLAQPDFLNQVLEFEIPTIQPAEVLKLCLEIEKKLGRVRGIDKGPRTLDIDLLFWQKLTLSSDNLDLPHPRLFSRSFIVLPLRELPYFKELEKSFDFPDTFSNSATPFI